MVHSINSGNQSKSRVRPSSCKVTSDGLEERPDLTQMLGMYTNMGIYSC